MNEARYLALIGCVNRTILDVKLTGDFKIKKWPVEKFIELYCDLTTLPEVEAWIRLDNEWGYGIDGRSIYQLENVYLISKCLPEYPMPHFSKKMGENFLTNFQETDHIQSKVMLEVKDMLTKLRLFDDGSIAICYEAFYGYEDSHYEMYCAKEENLFCEKQVYKVKKKNIHIINEILQSGPIFTKHKYINFALDNFSESYRVAHPYLGFISLMMAMEAIFNDGKNELRNKVSRGGAVLLGKNINSSRRIFSDLKKLYDIRSSLVHTGDISKIGNEELLLLRSYVRKSLLRVMELNLSKQYLSIQLSENGFGSYKSLAW